MHPEYDQADPKSIEKYGKRLVNGTLRKVSGVRKIPNDLLDQVTGGRTRGSFGTLLENYYYDIHPGNESAPDFKEAGVELKATPIKALSKGGHSAKERLVLGKINYDKERGLKFESSSFMRKNSKIMLVSYVHEKDHAIGDHLVKIANLLEYERLPAEDKKIIFEDWKKIQWKIDNRKEDEISEGDTFYLGACTKGKNGDERTILNDGTGVKPRAYAFKSGYMTTLTRRFLNKPEEGEHILRTDEIDSPKTFEELVIERFKPYMGMTADEIKAKLAPKEGKTSKGYLAILARRMMGVKGNKITEFESANVEMKTVQLKCNGMPKEEMSFPTFKFSELLDERWEAEDDTIDRASLKQMLQKRFFFVVFGCEGDCKDDDSKTLQKVFFWTMPNSDLEGTVARAWKKAQLAIKKSDPSALPKISDDVMIHVRPKGKNSKDVDVFPDGTKITKRCFWLNKKYIKEIIERN
jgi:DNA mismatch repair protein MutH